VLLRSARLDLVVEVAGTPSPVVLTITTLEIARHERDQARFTSAGSQSGGEEFAGDIATEPVVQYLYRIGSISVLSRTSLMLQRDLERRSTALLMSKVEPETEHPCDPLNRR
jgi:hypothetical protein